MEKPKMPLNRVMRDGVIIFCNNCHSTMSKVGFFGLFGKRYCDNEKCFNSKPRITSIKNDEMIENNNRYLGLKKEILGDEIT